MQWHRIDITKHNLFEFGEIFEFQVLGSHGAKTQSTLKLNVPETQIM